MAAGDGHSFIDRVAATEHPGMGVLLLKLIELTREQNEMIRWIMMDQHRRNLESAEPTERA